MRSSSLHHAFQLFTETGYPTCRSQNPLSTSQGPMVNSSQPAEMNCSKLTQIGRSTAPKKIKILKTCWVSSKEDQLPGGQISHIAHAIRHGPVTALRCIRGAGSHPNINHNGLAIQQAPAAWGWGCWMLAKLWVTLQWDTNFDMKKTLTWQCGFFEQHIWQVASRIVLWFHQI